MREFERKIKKNIDEYNMITAGEKIIVGLSGGADSVCLLLVLKLLGADVYAVHINHMLRGEEADCDEEFCKVSSANTIFELKITIVTKKIPHNIFLLFIFSLDL